MNIGSQAGIAATVTNDSQNGGVNWTVTCGSADCGSFQPTSTASTVPTTYTAPATIPTGGTVTVKATSVTDSTKSKSATITITQGGAISVVLSPSPRAYMNITSTAPFTAVVSNDSGNAGVNWTVTCGPQSGIPPCGSFSSTQTASGVPTTYQAPGAIPPGSTVTVTATSVTDDTKSASATVNIAAAPTTLADGTYVFNLAGTDDSFDFGPSNYYVAGAFTVSGGVITGGEQDFVDYSIAATDSVNGATSSIVGTPDGNLLITLDTGDGSIGDEGNGLEVLTASFVTGTRLVISENDNFATGTGTIDLQTSTAAPQNGYAFYVNGLDFDGIQLSIGGILNVDSPGIISGNGSVLDWNDAGLVFQNEGFTPSTVSATDSFGRVQFTLFPVNTDFAPDIVLIGYVVDGNTIQLVEGVDDLIGTLGGVALAQGANTGSFDNSSLSGSSYVTGMQGEDTNGPLQVAAVVVFNPNLTVSGNASVNDLANSDTTDITAGTYVVDSTGRATLTGLSGGGAVPVAAQLYLDGRGNALAMSADPNAVAAGPAYVQDGSGFTGLYAVNAQFATDLNVTPFPWSAAGLVNVDNSGTITGFTDFNVFLGPQTANVPLLGTTTGSGIPLTGTITGLDAASSTTPDSFAYYSSGFQVVGIETDTNQLGLIFFEPVPLP